VTTGPLGQGFGNAVGFAIAQAQIAATYANGGDLFDHYTYVMAGDGDMMEGISGEAASLAGHLKLGKLICLYDDNKISLAAPTSVTFTEDVGKRFEGYGWHVQHVEEAEANDIAMIDTAIRRAQSESNTPSIILVHSTIGFGSPRAGTFAAHGEPLGIENVAKTKEALGWPVEPAFLVPDDVRTYFLERKSAGAQAHAKWDNVYTDWKRANADLAKQFERARDGRLPDNLPWPTFNAENGNVASRAAGGTGMNAIAKALPELVGGSADLDPSTMTYLRGFDDFQSGTYGGRNIHFGVREHAMAAATNGIALHGGLLPFCGTFFNFLDYCKPALRLSAVSKVRCIYVFTHDSVFLGEDGPTHQPIEQLATLRATPNVIDIRPADALETLEAWKFAIQPETGPSAIVLSRQTLPYLGDREAAVSRGAYILDEPAGTPDLILIASGSEVHLARAAAKLLAAKGTKARVVSMPSFYLFDKQDESYRESVLPAAIKARVSIEAGATLGWHKYIGDRGFAFGLEHFGTSAPGPAIATEYGFTSEHIADIATGLLSVV
jgi:transketolase